MRGLVLAMLLLLAMLAGCARLADDPATSTTGTPPPEPVVVPRLELGRSTELHAVFPKGAALWEFDVDVRVRASLTIGGAPEPSGNRTAAGVGSYGFMVDPETPPAEGCGPEPAFLYDTLLSTIAPGPGGNPVATLEPGTHRVRVWNGLATNGLRMLLTIGDTEPKVQQVTPVPAGWTHAVPLLAHDAPPGEHAAEAVLARPGIVAAAWAVEVPATFTGSWTGGLRFEGEHLCFASTGGGSFTTSSPLEDGGEASTARLVGSGTFPLRAWLEAEPGLAPTEEAPMQDVAFLVFQPTADGGA